MGDTIMGSDESSCFPELPEDVLPEILIHLPVKTLLRFTCVCKSWLCLIRTDTQFAIKHYLARTSSSSSLMDNVDYLVDSGEKARWCMYSLTEKKTFRLISKLEIGPACRVTASNTCHGIMCMLVYNSHYVYSDSRDARILLCNPTIGEVVPVPSSLNLLQHREYKKIGLGFDSTSDDYKVVAIFWPAGSRTWQVDVYSVRNGHWHSLDTIGPLEQFRSLKSSPVVNANGRFLNWLGYLKYDFQSDIYDPKYAKGVLLTFDIVDEVFREVIYLPPQCPYSRSLPIYQLLPSSRCQACICCSYIGIYIDGDPYLDIWVLNGDGDHNQQMTWSKQVMISFHDPHLEKVNIQPVNYLWMNDKELFVHVATNWINNRFEVFHYDLDTKLLKRTGRRGKKLFKPQGYTASLVSIKGKYTSLYREEASTRDNDSKKVENQDQGISKEKDDDGGSVYFIRVVGRRINCDVRWSYSF